MRALDPDRLVSLDSGLWVLDACQPVAAVIDPITGELRRIVSWASTVPPISFDSEWVAAVGDGTSLWWQSVGGELALVDLDGTIRTVRLRRAVLRAAHGGVAWAARWPDQVLVDEADDPRVAEPPRPGRLVRIDRSGTKRRIRTPGPVLDVYSDAGGTWVLAQTRQARLIDLGVGYDLDRVPGWLRLPADVPDRLTFAEHGVDDGPEVTSSGTYEDIGWYDPPGEDHLEHRPVVAQGLRWYAGWPHDDEPEPPIDGGVRFAALMISGDDSEPMRSHRPDLGQGGRTCARSLRIGGYDDDRPVFEIDPGPGSIRAIEPVAGGVAVSVLRPGPAGRERAEVLHVDPTGVVRVLMDAAPSIDGLGWPVGPMPADATARLTAARELCADWMDGTGRLPSEAMREIHARVVGEWPHAAVVVEFSHPARDGARLRMRVLLFDELGRPWDLDDVWFDLWEDLETAHLPSIGDAVDGVLEIGPDRR